MQYKDLFRKLDRTLTTIERSEDLIATLSAILARLVDDFQSDLGLLGGRIYVPRGSHYVLQHAHPAHRVPRGFKIPASYPPIQEAVATGSVLRDLGDPGVDREIEKALGVKRFAAIAVGDRRPYLIAFTVDPRADREHVLFALNTVRQVINLKLRHEHLQDRFTQAREIQVSLLPRTAPAFWDFDLHGETAPAEEVGGDLYDYIPVSERSLGVAIADASGHGLPAALQARDAIIGLRMGVEENLRITATIAKLNRVVSRSALASKFISLFYAEIEPNGNLVYCNAGHPPPLLCQERGCVELDLGGIVLGPDPEAIYQRGYVRLEPGSILLAYTDGIVEAVNSSGEAFGAGRVREIASREPWNSARKLVQTVFREVRAFSSVDPPVDDQTVVAVIRRRAGR